MSKLVTNMRGNHFHASDYRRTKILPEGHKTKTQLEKDRKKSQRPRYKVSLPEHDKVVSITKYEGWFKEVWTAFKAWFKRKFTKKKIKTIVETM